MLGCADYWCELSRRRTKSSRSALVVTGVTTVTTQCVPPRCLNRRSGGRPAPAVARGFACRGLGVADSGPAAEKIPTFGCTCCRHRGSLQETTRTPNSGRESSNTSRNNRPRRFSGSATRKDAHLRAPCAEPGRGDTYVEADLRRKRQRSPDPGARKQAPCSPARAG